MAEGNESVTLDWATAPEEFRQAHDALVEENKTLKASSGTQEQELLTFRRRQAFEKVIGEVGGELPADIKVSLDDLGDVPAEQITPTLVMAKALEVKKTREDAEVEFAKQLNFASVEEYRAFKTQREEAIAENTQGLSEQAAAAATGATGPTPQADPEAEAWAAFNEAKKRGLPDEDCSAAYHMKLEEATVRAQSAGVVPAATQ